MRDDPLSDFRNFLYVVWKFLNLPDPTALQYDIASFLQTGPRRSVIEAFRGFGKSWVTAAFVCWLLREDPQLNILVVSASKTRADNFTTFCRLLIDGIPELQHLRPRGSQRDSKIMFDVAPAEPDQSPSVMSAGITGQITGMRADVIIGDDIEVPNNSATMALREKLAEAIKEFDAILKPLDTSRIIYLGTPQTESSIYNLLPDRGYTIRVWPARYPSVKQRESYGDRLAPIIRKAIEADAKLEGRTTEGIRFTDLDLVERETSYGRAGFALQFMLDTKLSDADRYPLKLRDLCIMPLDPTNGPTRVVWAALPEHTINDIPNVGMGSDRLYRPATLPGGTDYSTYTGKLLAIDPSGRGRDETGWVVLYCLNGLLFLMDAGGFNGYGEETLKALAVIAAKWKVNKVVVEANFGDGMFTAMLKPVLAAVHPCSVEEVKHSTQKERRICDTLEPVMGGHRLVVNQDLLKRDFESTQDRPAEDTMKYQLFYQLTRITRDKGALGQDDRLDALAIAVAHFTHAMAADNAKAADRDKQRKLDAELRRFMAHTLGRKPTAMNWAAGRA